jgi:hypothetical protein
MVPQNTTGLMPALCLFERAILDGGGDRGGCGADDSEASWPVPLTVLDALALPRFRSRIEWPSLNSTSWALLMNPWFAKSIVLVASLAIIVVPAFVHRRDGKANVMKSRRGPLESVLLALTSVGFVVPLVWVVVPVFAFAEYQLHPAALVVGSGLLATGLWLIYRSHTDLGTNWSITRGVAGETEASHTRRLPAPAPPDVPGSPGLFGGSSRRASQLAGRPVLLRCVDASRCVPDRS